MWVFDNKSNEYDLVYNGQYLGMMYESIIGWVWIPRECEEYLPVEDHEYALAHPEEYLMEVLL